MKSRSNLKLQFVSAGIVAAIAAAGAAGAANLPKEGKFDVTACWSSVSNDLAFSKTHTAFTYEMTGTILSNPPGGMFDNSSFRCVGMQSVFNGKNSGGNVCESIDADGDKRLSQFSISSDGKVSRETVAGTGKYEGMVQSTTVMPLGPFPVVKAGTSQACNHQTGTYKLK
jgi:hypothetical protein